MKYSDSKKSKIPTSIAPWCSVGNGHAAIEFYKAAFGSVETYRMETPDGIVAKLSVDGAEFWVSGGSNDQAAGNAQTPGGEPVRMILTVANPDALFDKALHAGALQIFPVGEAHGWRLGRLVDPFGLHWEIGHPV